MAPWVRTSLTTAGFLLHLVVGFFYLGAGLIAPFPAVMGLMVVWAALLALAIWRRRNPWWVVATPFVAAAVWLVTLRIGELLFGWTA